MAGSAHQMILYVFLIVVAVVFAPVVLISMLINLLLKSWKRD